MKKVADEFEISMYMARKSKELVKEKGILSFPHPRRGRVLPPATVAVVRQFFESDDAWQKGFRLSTQRWPKSPHAKTTCFEQLARIVSRI